MDDPLPDPVLAQVLLHPNTPAKEVLRTALLLLTTAGYLRVEEAPGKTRFSTGPQIVFLYGEGRGPLTREVAVVLETLFPPGKPKEPLATSRVVQRLQNRFGYDFGKYISQHLRPRLIERGWMREEEYRWLWIIPRRRYPLTPEGERMRDHVDERLDATIEVPELLDSDPPRALGIVAALGPLALLAEPIRPYLAELGETARLQGGMFAALDSLSNPEEQERRLAWLDMLDLLSTIDWDSALQAFDTVADAGDAGGDGGGDGGGE